MKIRFVENRLSRRRFLRGSTAMGAAALLGSVAAPRISRAAARPIVTHGIQSGDAAFDRAVLWSRADRPANAIFEWSTTDSFKDVTVLPKVAALPESDFTAKILATDLPSDQDIFYRVKFQDLSDSTVGKRAADRPSAHRTDRPARRLLHLVGRHRRPGLGHRRGSRRHDGLFHHAEAPARFLPPFRRQHLCRRRAAGRGQSARRQHLEEPGDAGEVEARGNARRVRGQYKYNFMDKNVLGLYAQVPVFTHGTTTR